MKMQTLTREQLKAMLDRHEDLVLINVLGREPFEQAHIPGSYNIPVAERDFTQRVQDIAGNKHGKVMVYCASFECNASPSAARQLDQAGFSQVYDYEGGTKDWQEAGYAIETGTGH
jgi:rhodanese-related sulfurtransferase